MLSVWILPNKLVYFLLKAKEIIGISEEEERRVNHTFFVRAHVRSDVALNFEGKCLWLGFIPLPRNTLTAKETQHFDLLYFNFSSTLHNEMLRKIGVALTYIQVSIYDACTWLRGLFQGILHSVLNWPQIHWIVLCKVM